MDIPADLPETRQPEHSEKISFLKATAVRQAMFEVVGEHRTEIVKRAVAKLRAQGVSVTEADMEPIE